jgi:hypothetical protein
MAVLIIGDGRAKVIGARKGSLRRSFVAWPELRRSDYPRLERPVIPAAEADQFDGRKTR